MEIASGNQRAGSNSDTDLIPEETQNEIPGRVAEMRKPRLGCAICAFIVVAPAITAQSLLHRSEHWIATWATAQEMAVTVPDRVVLPPDAPKPDFSKMRGKRPPQAPDKIENQTIRMVVHTSIGGSTVRVELSNAFALNGVSIGAAHIAIRAKDSTIQVGTDRVLKFSGNPSVELRSGTVVVSDPVELTFPPMADLAVSLYVVGNAVKPANHTPSLHTGYISMGDTTGASSMLDSTTTGSYLWLRSVDVVASPQDFAIACLGDSITDGYGTTPDKDQAWPTLLANRFVSQKTEPRVAVINEGLSGNQILRDGAGVSALARLDRDVLSEPGVKWIVLLEGINDINIHGQFTGPDAITADELIKGDRQIIARAHLNGVKVMGATLTPDMGVWPAGPIGEATRQKLNQWIRTGGEFDAVVDLDLVLQDKENPAKLRDDLDPGDHIHPNDKGNGIMAAAFQLSTFEK